ncbi:MAG: chemotaxis protein CheW [Pseudomonadota bacterium]
MDDRPLDARLAAPAQPTGTDAQIDDAVELLSFSLAGQDFAVDIMLVREIRNWSEPTPLPLTPPYVLGVINLRGTVLPILDLSQRLSVADGPATAQPVYVVLNAGDRLFGVTVDAVSDILTVPRAALQEPPDMGERVDTFVSHLIVEEDRMIRVLRAEDLAPKSGAQSDSKHRPSAA